MSGVLFGIVWGGLGEVRLGALWAGMVVSFEGRVGGVRPFFPQRTLDQGFQKNLGASEPNEESIPEFKKPNPGKRRKKRKD